MMRDGVRHERASEELCVCAEIRCPRAERRDGKEIKLQRILRLEKEHIYLVLKERKKDR